MQVLGGRPSIGSAVTVGLDNPLGTQAAGAQSYFFLSLAPDPNFPAGTSVPGFGQGAPGAAGELLIAVLSSQLLSPAYQGPPWLGPGQPASITLAVPNDPNLVGQSIYGQGILIDPTAGAGGVRFGLTDAVELRIGL